MKHPLRIFPQEVVQQYNLKEIVAANSYVYMEIRKGITGLKQAGRLASNRLIKNIDRNGFALVKHTPSLWRHHTSNLVFYLVVDNVGIKYTQKKDHLLKSLRDNYDFTED